MFGRPKPPSLLNKRSRRKTSRRRQVLRTSSGTRPIVATSPSRSLASASTSREGNHGTREGSSIDKGEAALFKVLDSVRRETPSDVEMVRARSVIEKRILDETGTYLGRAIAFARSEANEGGFRSALDYRSRIQAVSAVDVQRAANTYLTIANTSIHEYEPFSDASRTFDSDTSIHEYEPFSD